MLKRLFGKCEWIRGVRSYLPHCQNGLGLNHHVDYFDDYKYCPYCGKKIKYEGKITKNVS